MAEQTPAEKPENWQEAGRGLFCGVVDRLVKLDLEKSIATLVAAVFGRLVKFAYTLVAPIGLGLAKGIAEAEDLVAPQLAEIAAAAASDVFGQDVPASAFQSKNNRGARSRPSDALGKGFMEMVRGQVGSMEPSEAGAQRFLGFATNMALEGWWQGWFFEYMSSLIPEIDVGKIETYAELDDILANALGIGRLSRSAIRPLFDATVVTPLEWKTNLTYRPKLLGASQVARLVARKHWSKERALQELARQGYTDDRIEALLLEQRKFLSQNDVALLVYRGVWTGEQGLQHLRDQGWDEDTATAADRVEGARRIAQLETNEANAIIAAYASRDIERGEFLSALDAAVSVEAERHLLTELADVRRAMNVKHLSLGQVEQMVKSGVLSVIDYRRAAEREGYDDGAVTALELQLRYELDKQKDLDEHRRELADARAAAKAARDAAAAARRADVEAARARARRGSEADLERAAIRGLIPLARVEDVYAAHYDAETVGVLVALLEDDRARYVAQQEARDQAAQRGTSRGINVGTIERAVLDGVLTVSQYRDRLVALHFADGDVALLVADLQARLDARTAAQQQRRAADAAAAKRSIDLGRYETLVRRGHRTLTDYDGLLASLGFDDASRAAMIELLEIRIADDTTAREERAAAAARLRAKGISLEQARRAVLLGIRDEAWFERFLFDQGFTTDAQAVLIGELRDDVAEADAARQRRATEPAPTDARALPLATVHKAARLGLISVADYRARLERAGYSAEDIDLDVDLLLLEIADVQAARQAADQAETAARARGLSLEQLARAVKSGNATLDAYRARAAELGYTPEASQALVAVLEDELTTLTAARARRAALDQAAGGTDLTLGQIEDGVKAGLLTVDDYRAELEARGYDADEAALLTALLVNDLEAIAANASARPGS